LFVFDSYFELIGISLEVLLANEPWDYVKKLEVLFGFITRKEGAFSDTMLEIWTLMVRAL